MEDKASKKYAIVGSGIAGLSTAWLLQRFKCNPIYNFIFYFKIINFI